MIKKGIIDIVSAKKSSTGKDIYSFKIGEDWFSGFGELPVNKGDEIEFEYIEKDVGDKIFKNVSLIINVKKKPTPSDMIGESAKKKRSSEMMMCAKDIIQMSEREDNTVASNIQAIKIVWEDLMKTIGEDEGILQIKEASSVDKDTERSSK